MSGVVLNMSIEQQQTPHDHLKSNSDEVFATHGEPSQKISSGCDEDVSCSSCLTHCTGVVILIESVDFGFHSRFSFSTIHIPPETVSNIFRLLRPPRLS